MQISKEKESNNHFMIHLNLRVNKNLGFYSSSFVIPVENVSFLTKKLKMCIIVKAQLIKSHLKIFELLHNFVIFDGLMFVF